MSPRYFFSYGKVGFSMSNYIEHIRRRLYELADPVYGEFQSKLIPDMDRTHFIGVRTPALRNLAKELYGTDEATEFLNDLPHTYFDENQLHAFLVSRAKPFDICIKEVDKFLPYVNNWATCDQMSPAIFKKNTDLLLPRVFSWIDSDHIYTVRFGIGMLMQHFLDDLFDNKYPEKVSRIRSDEYYINMMIAWYFATALAKQYDAVLPFLEEQKLSAWVHNKTIQKAVESYRITDEQKTYLRSLRIKKG